MAARHESGVGISHTERKEGVPGTSSVGPSLSSLETDLALSVIDTLEDGICLIDDSGRVRRINHSMENFFSLSRDEIEGMCISDFFSLFISPLFYGRQSGIPSDRSPSSVQQKEDRIIRVNSRTDGPIWLEYSSKPLTLAGNHSWRVDMYRRITRWKVTEARFVESEERYRLLFNKVNDAIFVFSLSEEHLPERFLEVNDIACDILGYTRAELLSLSPLNLVPPGSIGNILKTLKCLDLNRSVIYDSVNITRDGRLIPVETSSHLFSMGGHKIVISISRDIAERQKMENLKKKALIQINQNIEQFATLGDHIRNPLGVIIGLACLEESPSSERIIAAAKEIDDLVLQLDRGWIASENVRAYLRKHCA